MNQKLELPSRDSNKSLPLNDRLMVDLTVKSVVKDQLADQNVASDFYDILDSEAEQLLADAARRGQDNDRKTVQPRDLRK